MMWCIIKECVKKKRLYFSVYSVIFFGVEEFECISTADWASRYDHIVKIEKDYVGAEETMCHVSVSLKTNIGEDSSGE